MGNDLCIPVATIHTLIKVLCNIYTKKSRAYCMTPKGNLYSW